MTSSKNNENIIERLRGGLIVSCQALADEPLHSSFIMSRMAYAAMEGGAAGIRANSICDIIEIKKTVDLPIIGLIKEVYSDSEVYITPTMKEVNALVEIGTDIIAIDATKRMRPNGLMLEAFFKGVRAKYPNQLFMADCSSFDEGLFASQLGFDMIGTTMSGYTSYTRGTELPDYTLMKDLADKLNKPVIAEGGIWSPEQFKKAMELNVHAAVVGTAITRPREIVKKYVSVLK